MMDRIEERLAALEARKDAIEARNARVAMDKRWETSRTRRTAICLVTYLCGCLLFAFVLPTSAWYLAAIVPTLGYLLSTLGLPPLRKVWERQGPEREQ